MEQNKNICDLSFLENMTGNNKQMLAKYINMFLESSPREIEQMKLYLQDKNYERLNSVAHSMKPILMYMGIKELESPIKQIERCSIDKIQLEELPVLVSIVEQVCLKAREELRNKLNNLSV